MPSINATLIIAGGTLIFIAATLLILQLRGIGGGQQTQGNGSLRFYLMGLVYLLLGIIVGAGLSSCSCAAGKKAACALGNRRLLRGEAGFRVSRSLPIDHVLC
jgi:hypothetical protein